MPFAFVASSSFNFGIYCTKVDLLREEKKNMGKSQLQTVL